MAATSLAETVDPLLKLIESLGVLGVLVWYLWYVTSRDRPRLEARHQAAVEALATNSAEAAKQIAATNANAIENAANNFRAEAREQRQAMKENLESLVGEMREQRTAAMDVIRKCTNGRSYDGGREVEHGD